MTRQLLRNATPHRLCAAILLALLAPCLVIAQDEFSLDEPEPPSEDAQARLDELTRITSVIEFGFGYVDDDSFRFGRYRGLHESGGYGVLNIDWFRRGPWDGPDAGYTHVVARDLGLSTRSIAVEHGRQGSYRVRADYRQMPMYRSDSAQTIFNGVGSTRLTLPPNWVGAQNTAGMTQLLPSLGPVELRHERRRIGFGLDALLSERWDVTTNVRHENKQGLKSIGAVIGNSGGNPRAVLLPEPVDYETREADVALRYTDARRQLEFRYLVSLFDNGNRALSWQNPYSTIGGWQASVGFPNGFGQLALPPDNQFHQASVAGGYTWNNGLRLTSDVALGRMTQDEAFLPYTINPALAASVLQPLPRSSLDGRIDTTVANIRLSGRSGDRFHWNASARFDDRDNRTARAEYVYIGGDSALQNRAVNSSSRRFNEPYSFRETRLRVDAGYRLARRTKLTAVLESYDTERTYSEREQADETRLGLTLSHAATEWFNGSLRFIRADRTGSTYHGDEPFLSGYSPGYTSTVAGGWENPPGLRKFHQADRERDRWGANVTLTPGSHWSIGLDAQRVADDYHRSELGLTRSDSDVYTIDVSFVPSTHWSTYAFFSREDMDLAQKGQSIRTATRIADATDPARAWFATHADDVDTAGAGFQCNLLDSRLKLGADYVLARSRSQIDVSVGSALTAAALPPDRTRLTSVSLTARYRLRANLDLQGRIWNERFRSTDFALDTVEANQLANVILLGEESPDYDVNVVTLSLLYRF
jgi:MtrB/PioB family decaheme-associated outer membrane protein